MSNNLIDLTESSPESMQSSPAPPAASASRNNAFSIIMAAAISAGSALARAVSPDAPPIAKTSLRRWEVAIDRLRHGHVYRGQGSGPMTVTPTGCWLPAKTNVNSSGYVQIAPGPVNLQQSHELKEPDVAPQLAHRVSLYISTPANIRDDIIRDERMQASHLCSEKRCFNPAHLTWETKEQNEARKNCAGRVDVVCTNGGQRYILRAAGDCPHMPHCIPHREERQLELLQ